MGSTRQWIALQLALMAAAAAPAAEITLTPDEQQRVAARGVVIRATLDDSERRGTVRAAIRIDAPPDIVFGQMTRCADALQYVPHMRLCRVREQAPDGSWQLVEQEIDFGWYAPRIRYVFRADLVAEGSSVVGTYDWPVVAEQILRVYETVTVGAGRVREVRS